jgi:gamma-glutamylcyclotransferase (GGCT)/AIG2-like uncharacterized protein YtfP
MLYFAYGSNMNIDQMRERCGNRTLQAECVAKLEDHRLAFTRWSPRRKCGCADAVADAGSEVWGVVFRLSEAEQRELDKSEGYDPKGPREKNAYVREERIVYRDGDKNQPLPVKIYFVVEKGTYLPNTEYKNLILQGARYHNLPLWYICQLEKIEVSGS